MDINVCVGFWSRIVNCNQISQAPRNILLESDFVYSLKKKKEKLIIKKENNNRTTISSFIFLFLLVTTTSLIKYKNISASISIFFMFNIYSRA